MPYLRACIKEGLRLYPPVSGTARMTQKDLVLSGYQIPIGTNVVTWPQLFYRQEKFFSNSSNYLPERWLKDIKACPHTKAEKFHFLPFGHGVRACPGKRIANMEMEVLMINLLRKFKVEWHQEELQVNSVLVNIPVGDIRFKLVEL
jgi:cytochrome P450 family 12